MEIDRILNINDSKYSLLGSINILNDLRYCVTLDELKNENEETEDDY